jgi:hypothetical protein
MTKTQRVLTQLIVTAVLAAASVGAGPAFAQASDTVNIESTGEDAVGRIGVNAAAGILNQQVNAAVISESETVLATNAVTQALIANNVCVVVDNQCGYSEPHVSISGAAFAGAHGAISINGAAGAENQQANLALFGIAHGIDSRVALLTSAEPDPCITGTGGRSERTSAEKVTDIDPGAFADERAASDQPDGWREEFLRQVRWLATERE